MPVPGTWSGTSQMEPSLPESSMDIPQLGPNYGLEGVQHMQAPLQLHNRMQEPALTTQLGSSELDLGESLVSSGLDPGYADDDFLQQWSNLGRKE